MFSLVEKFFISLFALKVGEDNIGNVYYISKFAKNYLGKNKRFVTYNSIQDPTKVDSKWHSWLHYLSDEVPIQEKIETSIQKISSQKNQNNIKPRLPNLTGTKFAYLPKMNKLKTEQIKMWRPE